ncbi:MAG: hypothetical protein M3Z04_10920, partial [Chloroflexota bacterium]|nr:hypothetical protein [Chloroflexota bacterium]
QLLLGSLPLLAASALFEAPARITWNGEFVGILLFLALVGTAFTTALATQSRVRLKPPPGRLHRRNAGAV